MPNEDGGEALPLKTEVEPRKRSYRTTVRLPEKVASHPIVASFREDPERSLNDLAEMALRREVNRQLDGVPSRDPRAAAEERLRNLVMHQAEARENPGKFVPVSGDRQASDMAWSTFIASNCVAQELGRERAREIVEDVIGRSVRWY